MFFCEGIIVLFRIGLFLMVNALSEKNKLYNFQQQDTYETLNLLKNFPLECCGEEKLVKHSCMIKIDEAQIAKALDETNIER